MTKRYPHRFCLQLAVASLFLCFALTGCHRGPSPQEKQAIAKAQQHIQNLESKLSKEQARLDKASNNEGTVRQWFWDDKKVNALQKQVALTQKRVARARQRLAAMTGPPPVHHTVFWYLMIGVGALMTVVGVIVVGVVGGYLVVIALTVATIVAAIAGLGWLSSLSF